MRYALALVLILLGTQAAPAEAAPAADAPLVRIQIDRAAPIYVGQSLRVEVTVLVPNYFMSSPRFPLFDLPGAVVTMPSGGAANVSEIINGTTYAGIKRSYVVVPQREGTFVLPPARITFQYAAVPGKPSRGSVDLPPERFEAGLPPGAKTAAGTLPVARITISQQVQGLAGEVRVGDAITRTIDVFADHTQSMMIPPPRFVPVDGVRIYEKDPQLTDEKDQQGHFLGGRRVDGATYLFEEPGSYVLPEIALNWFDPSTGSAQVSRAPAITVSVVAGPAGQPAIAPEAEPAPPASSAAGAEWRRWLVPLLAGVLAALVVVWLIRRWSKPVASLLAARRAARRESVRAYFSRLIAACRSNDPARTYDLLGAWVRRSGAASITGYLQAVADHDLSERVTELERYLYSGAGDATPWTGAALAMALQRTWRSSGRVRQRAPERLSALNPTGGLLR